MWHEKKVSVVFSTYNEKDSIRKQIEDCFNTGFVDEVIVVNNNAVPGTKEEVAKTPAKQFFESRQGFGWGYRRALSEATGDLIVMSEPDGTYDHRKDLQKLLIYSDDFPVVLGTRTTQALISEGANMGVFLKWGNVFIGKLIEVLFNTTHLSDAGCTLLLLSRSALKNIQPHFKIGGNHFSPEINIFLGLHRIPFIEIPVHYQQRIGESHGSGTFWRAFKLGLKKIWIVLSYRVKYWFKPL